MPQTEYVPASTMFKDCRCLANYAVICSMLTYISADLIYPVLAPPIPKGVVAVHPDGLIHSVLTSEEAADRQIPNIKRYSGIIVPGFVNTHCHLELSHLWNQIESGKGLVQFIKGVLSKRNQPETTIMKAMELADQQMYDNGIVAVGDISNQLISKEVKLKSKLYYQTFVEVFGFNAPAKETIAPGLELREQFEPLKASIVPHAPYSVSEDLFHEIGQVTRPFDALSIHNQETVAENELFQTGSGDFAELFANLNIAQSAAHNSKQNSIQYHLPRLPKTVNTLLVHNTFTNQSDLSFAKTEHQRVFFCLCPNANLYIENDLPNVPLLVEEGLKITLGTDSLGSNRQLSILAEMKVLQDHFKISFDRLLSWATINGAEFLGIAGQYGSITPGKTPGLVHIDLEPSKIIKENSVITRLC